MRALLASLLLLAAPPAMAETRHTILEFSDLDGWERDDHEAALEAFVETCPDLDPLDWQAVCVAALGAEGSARGFFEALFTPVLIEDGAQPLFTAYFEPEISGSRYRSARFAHPVYAMPAEARYMRPYYTRREIDEGAIIGEGHEIAWVEDPVDLFFLQIQGSGRIVLDEGGVLRVGYAGKNGHEYRSVGRAMVARGLVPASGASAEAIRAYVRENPEEGMRLLQHNPSYVFFRTIDDVPAEKGPLGAMLRSITPMRSIAVDPKFTPLGAPVWIETRGRSDMRRLMVAQDVGSAIKGAQRADIFYGTGRAAGLEAGSVKDRGRMVVLLPVQRAWALLPDPLS